MFPHSIKLCPNWFIQPIRIINVWHDSILSHWGIQGGAQVDIQLWVPETEFIPILILLCINYCIIFQMNNCKPTFATPLYFKHQRAECSKGDFHYEYIIHCHSFFHVIACKFGHFGIIYVYEWPVLFRQCNELWYIPDLIDYPCFSPFLVKVYISGPESVFFLKK